MNLGLKQTRGDMRKIWVLLPWQVRWLSGKTLRDVGILGLVYVYELEDRTRVKIRTGCPVDSGEDSQGAEGRVV